MFDLIHIWNLRWKTTKYLLTSLEWCSFVFQSYYFGWEHSCNNRNLLQFVIRRNDYLRATSGSLWGHLLDAVPISEHHFFFQKSLKIQSDSTTLTCVNKYCVDMNWLTREVASRDSELLFQIWIRFETRKRKQYVGYVLLCHHRESFILM